MKKSLKIALVVGHRNGSQGSYGNTGISEWKYWKEFLAEMIEQLPLDNQYQIFLRNDRMGGYTNEMIDLHKRIDVFGADLSVSFHFNGSGDSSIHGNEVLYCSDGGKKFAEILNGIFRDNLQNNNRGIKKREKSDRGGGFLCRGRSKCILVEPFFESHQNEFVDGGSQREVLMESFIEFFQRISEEV